MASKNRKTGSNGIGAIVERFKKMNHSRTHIDGLTSEARKRELVELEIMLRECKARQPDGTRLIGGDSFAKVIRRQMRARGHYRSEAGAINVENVRAVKTKRERKADKPATNAESANVTPTATPEVVA